MHTEKFHLAKTLGAVGDAIQDIAESLLIGALSHHGMSR